MICTSSVYVEQNSEVDLRVWLWVLIKLYFQQNFALNPDQVLSDYLWGQDYSGHKIDQIIFSSVTVWTK